MKNKILKTTALMLALVSGLTASAFNFPTPDWGALLDEKTKMVTTESFELYIEGPANSAPYFGAKFEPSNGVIFGAVAEYSDVFEKPVSGYLTYFDMNYGQTDVYYPANEMIRADNVITTVGFTITDINNVNFDQFRTCLNNLAAYNKPMFIRFANEMNVSPIGDEPEVYKSVFRQAVNMIREYPQFAVVWSPNDLGALDRPFEYYYPGDEYVDWIGVSSYMKRFFQGNLNTQDKDKKYFMINEYAWHTNSIKPIVEFMKKNNINKPLMVSEGGVSWRNTHEADNTWWALPRIRNMYWNLIMEYPQVKLINYFNVPRPSEVEQYSITDNPTLVEAVNEALRSGAYIREYGESAEFAFKKANDGHTVKAKGGIINLYTSAYVPNKQDIRVTYTLDGNWYHSSADIPYICKMDINAISDGAHTLEIDSGTGTKKTYTFTKKLNAIKFGEGEPDIYPTVIIDGEEVIFDQQPMIENGRTLVPMRAIFEKLGAMVEWNQEEYIVTATAGEKKIIMGIGNSFFWVNDKKIELDVPSKIENGRTLVPLRAISDALGCNVAWDGATYTVTITK